MAAKKAESVNRGQTMEKEKKMDKTDEQVGSELGAKCSREKFWCELDNEGKLERIRQIIRTLQIRVSENGNSNRLFHEHKHLPDGKAAVSINEKMQGLSGPPMDDWDAIQKGEVFF